MPDLLLASISASISSNNCIIVSLLFLIAYIKAVQSFKSLALILASLSSNNSIIISYSFLVKYIKDVLSDLSLASRSLCSPYLLIF